MHLPAEAGSAPSAPAHRAGSSPVMSIARCKKYNKTPANRHRSVFRSLGKETAQVQTRPRCLLALNTSQRATERRPVHVGGRESESRRSRSAAEVRPLRGHGRCRGRAKSRLAEAMRPPRSVLNCPPARRDPDSGYTAHGRWFDDPYAWLERLDDAETQAWIAAQEAVTRSVLDAVPGRERLRAAVARSSALCAAVAADSRRPGRTRVLLAGRRERREAQVHAAARQGRAARDGARPEHVGERRGAGVRRAVARRRSGRVREGRWQRARRGDPRARRRDGAAASRPAPRHTATSHWPGGRTVQGFFYAACPEPGEVPAGDEAQWHAIYEHRLGSDAPARRVFGDDHVKEYWCAVEISECGRFAVLYKWDFVHANVVYLLRLADDALVPVAPDMRSVNQRAGYRRQAARPHRPRRPARPPLRRAAGGTDRVADAHPRRLGHAADGHGRRRPALRRVLAGGVASRAHPCRRRHLPTRA